MRPEIESSRNNKRAASFMSDDLSSGLGDASPGNEMKEDVDIESSIASLSTQTSTDATATDDDLSELLQLVKDASANGCISQKKALKYDGILQPGRLWKDMIFELLRESIPNKRTKKNIEGEAEPVEGYKCKICLVALKGHICPYCEVCSTSERKHKKDDGRGHTCINCPTCYYEQKKKKKLLQVKIGKCKCSAKDGPEGST